MAGLSCGPVPLLAAFDFLDPENILDWLGPWAAIGLFAIIFAESGLLIGFFLRHSLISPAYTLSSTGDIARYGRQ